MLDALLERPLKDARLRYLLLVALSQLEYGKSASHAVVDNAVRASAGFKLPWAEGLVNAVLRNFLRRRDMLLKQVDGEPAVRFSYPHWWVAELQDQYPADWEYMLAVGNGHPPMTLRVNVRKVARDAYLATLADGGISARATGEYGITLERPMPVEMLPGFSEGLVSVQDLGAQQAAPLLDVRNGMQYWMHAVRRVEKRRICWSWRISIYLPWTRMKRVWGK